MSLPGESTPFALGLWQGSKLDLAPSSSGRTRGFEPLNVGSIPTGAVEEGRKETLIGGFSMTQQDDIERDRQAEFDWQDRQVWCARCEKWIREMGHFEHHPIPDEFCTGCMKDIEMEQELEQEEDCT